MAGLKGFQREPAADTRARRNSASLASFSQFIGSTEVIQLSGLGELTLRLKSDGGLVNTTGELSVKLDGSTLALSASGLAADPAAIDHDALLNFAANEHVDHSTVNVDTTAPLTGGGDLTATRTLGLSVGPGLAVNASNELQVENANGASTGDLYVYDGTAWQRLAVGTNDEVLTADSTATEGIAWKSAAAGSSPTTTKGDLEAYDGSNLVRLPVGTNDQVLTADSGATEGVAWKAASGGSASVTTSVDSVTPAIGFVAGGVKIVIGGRNFSEYGATGDDVTIGGTSATNITVLSDSEISCEAPSGTAGDVDVVVTSGGDSDTLTDGFTYISTPILADDFTLQTSNSGTWTHNYTLPSDTDLLLITSHFRDAEVDNITFGGAPAVLVDKEDGDFPQTYIYAIPRDFLPAAGSRDLVVTVGTGNQTGATSIIALQGVAEDVISNVSNLYSANQVVFSDIIISTDITLGFGAYVVVDAVSARDGGATLAAASGQTQLFYDQFGSPRGAGASYKEVSSTPETSMEWNSGFGSNRLRHVLAGVRLNK